MSTDTFAGFHDVPIDPPPAPGKANGHAPGPMPFAVWSVADMQELEAPTWVIEGVIQLGTRVLLFAPSGHHKTNVTVDAVCRVAHGMDYHGQAVASHPVIIVATEDPHGCAMRVLGWHDYHAKPSGRVLVVPGGELRLNDPETVARLRATAEAHFPGEKVGFIVDHYDVSIDGDPTATAEAVGAAEGLRALGNGSAFVMLLAHAPWTTDQRAKVPVTLWANTDARLKCERDEVTGKATVTVVHQKNGPSGLALRFEFEAHDFSTRKGAANCLIAHRLPADDTPPKPVGPKLGDNEKITLDCLAAAIVDIAQEVPASREVPRGVRGVRYEEWEATAMRFLLPGREEFRRTEAFKRAATSLLRKRVVRHVDGWCWLPPRTASHASHDIA